MKKTGILLLLAIISYCLIAQESDTLNIAPDDNESSTVILDYNEEEVSIGTGDFIKIEEKGDTTRIKIGDKGISIVENDEGTSMKIIDSNDDNDKLIKKKKKFKGHWAGAEFGLNNFIDDKFSMTRSDDEKFMDLNTSLSWNFNFIFIQYSIGLVSDRFGLVTGLGLEFNDYHFDGDNSIQKDSIGVIITKDNYPVSLSKSKLSTTFLTVPLLLELQLLQAKRSKRIHIAGGIIAGLKIGSHTKVVYKENGKKQKDKSKDDFNINPLRYGFTARVGYRSLNLYGNYYMTPFFEKGGSPELYPFTVGLSFSF